MSILLLKNKYRLQIKQVLLCSTCFVLFSIQVIAQKKWAAIDAETTSGGNIRVLKVDSTEDKLIIGGYVQSVNGVSSCSVYKWSPEGGVEILSPYDPYKMAVIVANDVFFKGDSMVVLGSWGMAIRYNDQWVYNLFDPSTNFHEVIPYGDDYLVAFGNGKYLQGQKVGQLLNWDGDTTFSEFHNISDFINDWGFVQSVIEYKNEVYVGGNASTLSGGIMQEIMCWTGTEWTDVGGGIRDVTNLGGVNVMMEYQGDLYIGGQFAQRNHSKENHIARWDGQQWLPVGGGVKHDVRSIYSMHVYDGYLYVGGAFDTIGGIPAESIARWDGKEWCSCRSDFGGFVLSMTHYRDTLYVAGNFNTIDGDTIYKIAKFIGDDFADTCGSVSVGIKTLEAEKMQIVGYPNPAQNSIHLMLPELQNQEVEILVYNQVGQLMFQCSQYLANQKLQLDLSPLSQGMYFGELITKNKNYVFSFVKE